MKTWTKTQVAERLSDIKSQVDTKALSVERAQRINNFTRSMQSLCFLYQMFTLLVAAYAIREYWPVITSAEAMMNVCVKPVYWLVGLYMMRKTVKVGSESMFTPLFGKRLQWLGYWIMLAAVLGQLDYLTLLNDSSAIQAYKWVDLLNSVSWGRTFPIPFLLGPFFIILGLLMEEAAKLKAENDLVV